MEKERAVKESNFQIAKKMREDGVDIDTIKKYTGLKKWDIEKL